MHARTRARCRSIYQALLQVSEDTLGCLDETYKVLVKQCDTSSWCSQVERYRRLIMGVIAQTQ